MGDILDQRQIPEGLCTSGVHKFRCQKPYENKTFKIPNTGTTDRLQSLRAIRKTISSKKTLDLLKELKEIKEGQVPLPPEVPDCRSKPLSREPRPSALPPTTRKRVASTLVHRPGKAQRSLDMSTMFEKPMDVDHWSSRVFATSPRPCAGDASEKVNEDDTVPGLSSANFSADQRGLVISPHFQEFLQPSSPTQGALGSSTSCQDTQGLSLSTQEVLGGTKCDQGSMGHSISSQASQKPPPCAERKIKHVSLFRRGFRSPSSSRGVINHSNSPPKSFRQTPSDQGGLQQAPLDKESSKRFSLKGVLSDFSFSQNEMCPTPSPQGSLTPMTAAKDEWRSTPSHEESQGCFPSPQNDPKQYIAAEMSLSPASSDQGNFITSPSKQEGFKCPPPENGLRSSLTAQGGPSPITTTQVSLTPLMPTQAETNLSTSTSGIQEPLPSSEGVLESYTCLQEMVGTPKSTQGTLLPSQHTQRALAPASTSLGVLSPSVSVKRTPELSTSREEGRRPILSHKEKFKPNPDMRMDNGYSHYSKKRKTDPPFEEGGFPVSLSDQEGLKHTLPIKKALLIHHQKQNSQRYAKRVQVNHARSTTTQGAKTIQPSLLPQGSLGLSTCIGEALEISTYTPGLPGHLQPVLHFLGSTICDKGTVGQDTSAEGVPDSSPSLEMALGCDTCTQQFVANFTSREGDSSDSTCPQTPTEPFHSSQEAVEISPSPQGYQQSVTTTQEAIGHSPSSQRDVSLSTCPQVTPEHSTNTPKGLNSILSSQGHLEPVLSIHLSLEPNISIQNALSSSSLEESVPETFTLTQGAPVTSLAAHEDFRRTTYAQETLGDTTPIQVLETSPHSEAVVKKHTYTPDTVAPSPSEQEALGSTMSEEGTLPSSPSTQKSFMHIPSQEGNIKHPPSTQVYPGLSISTKKRLSDDLSDEGDFGTSSSEEGSLILLSSSKRVCASSTAPKETLITTSSPQLSPMPSISVQKALQCSSSEQKTVEPCHSNQGPHGHSVSYQEAQGPSLSVAKGLCHLPSVPGLQGHSPSLSKAPENSTYIQGDLSISKFDLGALKSSLSAKGSKGKAKCKQKHLEPLPLAQEDPTPPMSSKPSKDPYASSCLLAAEHFPSSPGSPVPSTSKQWYLGTSSSFQGLCLHNTGSPGQLKNIPEYMITDHNPVVIYSLAQGTLRHLPSAQGDVGLPLSVQQSPELPTLEQGSIQPVKAAKVALVNPSSPKGATGHFQCAQYALEHLPPSEGALKYSSTLQGTQGSLKSSQESLKILSSNSEHVKNSLSATGGLLYSPPGPKVLEHMLAEKQPEQLSISTQGSLGNSLSIQEAQEHLTPSMGNLRPCQSTKEELQTLIPSQIVLESAPSISEDLGALLSALEHMELSSLVNESPENPQYADSVVESSSATGALNHTLFVQQSLENSLPGKGIRETLSYSQGALEIFSSTKGRVENVSSPDRSVKPPTSLQEASRPSPLIQGPYQHTLSSQGPLGPSQTDSGIQGPLSTPETGGNLSREPGSWKSCPLTPETLDHLQFTEGPDYLSISAHGMFDSLSSTQGTLGLLVYSPGFMELSESEHNKLGHVSHVGKDGEISQFEKPVKSTSPLAPYLPFITEVLESSSCGLESLGSLLSSREDTKGTPSVPHAQEPSSSTSQALEHFVNTQGPLQINTPDEQTLCPLPSTVEDIEHSTFSRGFPRGTQILPSVLDHLSSIGESEEFSLSAPGTKDIPLLAPEPLEHSSLQNANQATSPCLQEVVGFLISEQGSLGWSPSAHGSLKPLASTLEAEGPSISEADTIQLSASAPVIKAHLTSSLGPSASKYYDWMKEGFLPSLHGDLEASQSDQRTLEMTKFAEVALENLSVAQRTTKLSTCSQEANKSSLSDQDHLLHSPHVKEALIPALSDQETEESLLLPSEDTQHPPSSASAQIKEPSLSTLGPQEPLKLSVSACDSLCPFPSSLGSETVELSTSSPECWEPSQSAQGELEYFSTVGKTIEQSSTVSQTTRKLSSLQGCGGHLSSAPSVQKLFQSGPVNLATLLSSQGPQKPFKLTQGLLHPSASAQESQEPSESFQDVGTHESSERIHEYVLPEVEPVETFTSVSGSIVTSPSGPQALAFSSLLHVTSPTSLTDQKVVGPRPPSQRALEVLSLAEGTLEPLASSQGDGRNSQLEKDTVEQSFSVKGILGSLPCTPGVLRSTPYAHKLPEILPSTQKGSLSPKGSLVLPISAKRTLENLQTDHELTKHSNSFQETSRHSLFVQGPLQDSPSASETLRPSSNQGIKKPLLSSPGAVKPSSSTPDTNKPLQTTLMNQPTHIYNQGHWENSMSLQGTMGSFSSRSGPVEHSASSPLILAPPESFQSKLEHVFCTDTSPSFQGPTVPLSFPSGTTGYLQHGTISHESSLSASKDLAHFLSDQLYISTQGTLASSPYSQQSLQQSSSSQEMLGPSKFDQCTHSHMPSVPDNLGMSPFVPMITGTLPQTPMTPGLFALTQASPVPSSFLQKDDESCLSSQATLEVNISGQDTLKPSPTTQVPEKVSLYTKPTLVKPTGAQSTEGHSASKSGTNQSTQKELGVSPPAQRQVVISLSTQGTLGSCSSDQGALGTSLSVQGSLKLSTPTQETVGTLAPSKRALKHPISSQESPKFYSSAQHTVQSSASSPRATGLFQSSQKPQGSFLSSLAHTEHLSPAPSAQENPLSNPWTLGPLLSSEVPKELSTATEETLPVLSSLSSIQRPSKHSGVLRRHQYSQNTVPHLSCVRDGVETSQSATRTIETLPPPLMVRGYLPSIQGSAESFPSGQGNLEPLKLAQGPPKHVVSSQEMLHSTQFAEGTLQLSTLSQAVSEPYINSPYTQVTRGTIPSVPGHLGLLASTQATPLSSCSSEKTVGTYSSSQGTLKMSKSAQGTLESSSASQVTGEFLLSAKGTMGNLTSVKQTVGPFTSMTGPLRSIQNTHALLGSLQSGQSFLQVSQAAEGPVNPLFPQGSLDLPVFAQGTPVTLLCNQGTRKQPASPQTSQKTSQSVKNSLQHPPSVPEFLNPSQPEKSKLESLSSPPGTGISVPGSQEIFQLSASSGYSEPLLYFGLPLELSVCAEGTLCPFSSPQGELDPLHCFSGNLAKAQPDQMNLSHLSPVREPVGNSPPVPGPREPSPSNQMPRELSSHVPGDSASLISAHLPLELNVSAQCSLSTSASSKGTLGSLLSSADIQGKVQNTHSYHGQLSHIRETLETSPSHVGSSVYQPCPQETLGLYSLGQGSQTTSQCAQETIGSCLSTQGSLGLSAQKSLGHPPPAQGLSGTSSHTQCTCSQSTSAQSTVAYSSSTPVSQGYSQHAKKIVETLNSDPGSQRISVTEQGSVEPLLSPWESPGYSLSAPDACKTFTATRGHVVSDDGPLKLSISAQANLSPFHSSQCLLELSLSVEGTFDLSTPMQTNLGPSVSSQGPLGSWQSAQRVQQMDPSASDSFRSMPSKGQMVISLSGQGTLGPTSESLEPLEISLSVQVSSRPSLSLQEAGGTCLSSQGRKTLEVSTYAPGNPVLSNSSRGDLGSSSYTPVTLGSSPPVKVDLGMSPSVLWTLRPPVSARGVLGTSTSAQEVSSASQGKTEPLPYAQDDMGLRSLSLGTEGNSQFSKGELKVLPSSQGNFKPALSTPGSVEKLLSASRTPRLFSSVLQDAGSFPLSSHNNFELSTSSQKHLESSTTPQTSLKHSPSSKESLGPTPSEPGTLKHSLQDQGWQKVFTPSKVTLGQTPHQKGYEGNSSSAQGTVRLSISGQESLGHCSFDQGSPESSTSSNKVQDPTYNQESVAQFPSVPGDTHSLSAQGILQNLSSSQVTLETSSSLQKDIEGSLDVHGAQQLQLHTPGYLGHSQFTPKSSETLSSPQMVFKFSESSPVTPENLPPLPGTLGHLISAQCALFPSDSDQQIQESSSSVQKSVQFSPSSKGSLRPTPSVLGTPQSLLSAQLCPKLSMSAQGFLGSLPPQQGCLGDSLPVQRAHGTSISAQEFLEHSKSDQESPEMFTSSQEDLGPSLAQEALVHSSFTPQDCGLSQSSKDTLGTSISTQDARKTPSSVQKSIGTVPSAPSVLGIQRPLGTSQFASETSEPSSEEFYSILKSISSSIKTLTSILEILRFSTFAKGTAGPSTTDQVILRSPTISHKALEFSPSDQQSVKSASSRMGPDRTSLIDKGLQEMSSGEKVTLRDSPLQQICSGNALSTQGTLGLSITAQESFGHSTSVHGSPDTSLPSEEVSGTCLDQGPLGPSLSLSLSDLGDLGLSEYSQGSLETSPSTHSTLEIPSSTHGIIETSTPAQNSLGHLSPSVQILQQALFMPETSEPFSSTEEACNISDSSTGTSETFPSIPGSLEISFSTQSTMGPSVSEKEILAPSVSLEEFLGPSPSDKGFLIPTPSASGTGSQNDVLSEQCCQEISSGVQGDSPSQQGYVGNSLHSQEGLGLSISAQEHSLSAQGSLTTSLSSQEGLGPSLDHGILEHSSSDAENLGLSDSGQGTLEIPPFTQSILEIPSSNNGVTETSTTSQDSLEHLPPSVQTLQPSLTLETLEPLPIAKEICKTSESVSGTLESFPSLLEALRHLNSDQYTLGPSVYDQGTLEPSTPLYDTLENSKPSQGVLEPIPSTQEGVGPFFSMEFLGLSICAHDDFIPIPSHDDCLRYSSYPNKRHKLSNSTKKIVRYAPFPEGNIRYSRSELDALRSLTSAKSRFTTSIYVRKDSSSTSPPLQSVPPPASSELNFRSRSPHKEDLRCSSSARGDSRHSKSKKTKSRHASKESHLKSVPSEDKGLKFHNSSKKGDRASVSNKVGARLKTEPKESLTIPSAKGGCRSSCSHEKGLRCFPSSQGIPRCSRSTKTKLEEASSNKADVHASHTEHEGCKHLSLSQRRFRHASSAKREKKPNITPEESTEASTSTEGDIGTTPSREDTLRLSSSPHGTSSLTSTTSTRARLRHSSYTQEVIKTSTEAQERFRSSPDGDSPSGSVKSLSSPQNNDVRHPVSTKEDFKHTLYVQEGQKPPTGAREGSRAWIPVQWGLIYSPIKKQSATSFSIVQGNFRHIRPQLADLRSSLSYQGRDTAFQYEHGTPICDPSVLGGHRYSHSVPCSLQRFPLQKKSLSSNFFPQRGIRPSLCDQRGFRLSYGHPVQGSFRMFQYERGNLKNTPSKTLSLRFASCDQRELKNVPSNVEWVRTSTSVPGSPQHNPSAHGGFKPYKPVKLKF